MVVTGPAQPDHSRAVEGAPVFREQPPKPGVTPAWRRALTRRAASTLLLPCSHQHHASVPHLTSPEALGPTGKGYSNRPTASARRIDARNQSRSLTSCRSDFTGKSWALMKSCIRFSTISIVSGCRILLVAAIRGGSGNGPGNSPGRSMDTVRIFPRVPLRLPRFTRAPRARYTRGRRPDYRNTQCWWGSWSSGR